MKHKQASPDLASGATLNRVIGLPGMLLHGTGTILGAGIYVLVGEVAAESGHLTALAFVLAGIVVTFSAYSYAQLSREFPVSAGLVSSATILRGAFGYLELFLPLPPWLAIMLLGGLLSAIVILGVGLSVGIASTLTLVEIAGLLLVIFAAGDHWSNIFEHPEAYLLPRDAGDLAAIGAGAFLAFYACIGFEDKVNMAEAVNNPSRTLPLAIALVLVLTVSLYVLVALLTAIGIAAVSNGALIQSVMASRGLYGMASRGLAPAFPGKVHRVTRTPVRASALTGVVVLLLALFFPMAFLAKMTSGIILCVFLLVILSLLKLNLPRQRLLSLAAALPAFGSAVCALFLGMQWWLQ